MGHPGFFRQTLRRYRLLLGYLRRETVLPGLPVSAIISSTSRCNLRCPMCPRAISSFANVDIDFTLFTRIIEQGAPYFEYVILQGAGEPLLNPRIFEMIALSRRHGLRTGFSTNATLLRGERIDQLLDSGLDTLILAVDGTTPEVYEKYREGASYPVTMQNIEDFLRRKLETRAPVHVTVQMVRLPDNQHQVEDFKRLWRRPGVDQVRIKEDEIRVEHVGLEEKPATRQASNPCHFLWQGPIYIEENGDVYPCCHAWTAKPLGNVEKEPLTGIWNNPRIVAMRKAHAAGDLSGFPECLNCQAPKPRLPLILGSFAVDHYRVRKIIPVVERLNLFHKLNLFEK